MYFVCMPCILTAWKVDLKDCENLTVELMGNVRSIKSAYTDTIPLVPLVSSR